MVAGLSTMTYASVSATMAMYGATGVEIKTDGSYWYTVWEITSPSLIVYCVVTLVLLTAILP